MRRPGATQQVIGRPPPRIHLVIRQAGELRGTHLQGSKTFTIYGYSVAEVALVVETAVRAAFEPSGGDEIGEKEP